MDDLGERLSKLSPEKRRRLEEHLRAKLERRRTEGGPPPVTDRPAVAPASYVQEELWLASLRHREPFVYNVPMLHALLRGSLDVEALRRALEEIVHRHDPLRTTLILEDGALLQRITPPQPVALPIETLEAGTDEDAAVRRILIEEGRHAFDLTRGPLFRARLVRLCLDRHLLAVTAHHAVVDAWSISIFLRELGDLYGAFSRGGPTPLRPLDANYAALAREQRLRGTAGADDHRAYWSRQLRGLPPLRLPETAAEGDASVDQQGRGAHVLFSLGADVATRLKAFSRQHSVTPQMTLLAAFQAVLHGLSGQTQFPIGLPIAQREERRHGGLIGLFASQLVIRSDIVPEASFFDLLRRVRSVVLDAFSHKELPFIEVLRAAHPTGSSGGDFIQVIFDFINQSIEHEVSLQDLEVETLTGRQWFSEFLGVDLFLLLSQDAKDLRGCLGYNRRKFSLQSMQALVDHFRAALETCLGAPETAVSRLTPPVSSALSPASIAPPQLPIVVAANFDVDSIAGGLRFWTEKLSMDARVVLADVGPALGVYQRAREHVGAGEGIVVLALRLDAPDAAPGELDGLVAALEKGARHGPTTIVVICTPNSAGRAGELCRRLSTVPSGIITITLDDACAAYGAEASIESGTNELSVPLSAACYAALATSAARRIHALVSPPPKVIVIDCDDCLWGGVCGEDSTETLVLDTSFLQVQRMLVEQVERGALLCLCSRSLAEDVWAVFDDRREMVLERRHVTAARLRNEPKSELIADLAAELGVAPSSVVFFDDEPLEVAEVTARCPEVRGVLLPPDPAARPSFLRHLWILDRPPPTSEDMRRAQFYRDEAERREAGSAAPSYDEFLQSLQLHVDVVPLTNGDVARAAQLTARASRFHASPAAVTPHAWASDVEDPTAIAAVVQARDRFGDYGTVGALRATRAAKALRVTTFVLSCRAMTRGIELAMLRWLGRSALELGAQRVEVAFASNGRNEPVRRFLTDMGAVALRDEAGPHFALPADVAAEARRPGAVLDWATPEPADLDVQLPLVEAPAIAPLVEIATRLRDASAILAAMRAFRSRPRPPLEVPFVAPRDDSERALAALWRECLAIEEVGIDDDFFDLGGSSLQALQLSARICAHHDVELPPSLMFGTPTIARLADVLRSASRPRVARQGDWGEIVPLVATGAARELFCFHGLDGDVLSYSALAQLLGATWSVQGVRLRKDGPALPSAHVLEALAAEYAALIRQAQPDGPIFLLGWSLGGLLAHATARVLQSAGRQLGALVLLDSYPGRLPEAVPGAGSPEHVPLLSLLGSLGLALGRDFQSTIRSLEEIPAAQRVERLGECLGAESSALLVAHLVTSCGLPKGRIPEVHATLEALDVTARITRAREMALALGSPPQFASIAAFERVLSVQPRLLAGALAEAPVLARGRALVIAARHTPTDVPGADTPPPDLERLWGRLVRPAPAFVAVDGDHFSILAQPHVASVARVLSALAEEKNA